MNNEVIRTHPAVTPDHLRRLAVVYIRQSTPEQVRDNTGSAAFQRSLVAVARSYGWADSQIVLLEDDLGKSGSSVDGRTDWQRLQEMVDADQVGAVFAANISRLSRRLGGFEIFRLRASYHNTLLYIDGRFLNPADANDAAVSQITAMFAQFENRKRIELMMQGKLAKAKRGEVMTQLPLGWIKTADGQYDHDPAVKDAIATIINTFRQTRSLHQTVKQLAQARITLPPRRFRSSGLKQNALRPFPGRKITLERIKAILTHPAYAGTYIYGLTRPQPGGGGAVSAADRGAAGRITKHDNHPAYMSREEQAEIVAILASDVSRRPIHRGRCRVLTKGLLRCANCGERLQVSRPLKAHRFVCRRTVEHTEKPCFMFSSDDLEPRILREVFRVLNTPPIHLLKRALKESRSEKRAVLGHIEAERERLERTERSAQEHVEATVGALPRLHFDALEKLEKVLQEREQFERKSAVARAALPKDEPTDEEVDELCRIASEVPGLWHNEAVTDEERKAILRHLIYHIVITATVERIDATIVWKNGATTPVFVWRAHHRRNLVRELHDQQLTPHEIKEHLAAGKTSTGQVVNLSLGWIQTMLVRMGLKSVRHPASYFVARRKAPELHREGRSLHWIARHFNQHGFASASPRPWTAEAVGTLLRTLGHKAEPLAELHYRLIAQGKARGQNYRHIAKEFNKKKNPALGCGPDLDGAQCRETLDGSTEVIN